MTRNYISLFAILWLSIAIVLIAIYSPTGFLAFKSKENLLLDRQSKIKMKKANMQLLENKDFQQDSLDNAFRIGYVQEGDEVFLYESDQSYEEKSEEKDEVKIFKGYSIPILFVISFAISIGVTILFELILLIFIGKRKKVVEEEEDVIDYGV